MDKIVSITVMLSNNNGKGRDYNYNEDSSNIRLIRINNNYRITDKIKCRNGNIHNNKDICKRHKIMMI